MVIILYIYCVYILYKNKKTFKTILKYIYYTQSYE